MKRLVMSLTACAALAGAALAQPAPESEQGAQAADLALTQALRSGDKAAAEDLMHRRFAFIDRRGKIRNRDEVLAAPPASAPEGNSSIRTYGRIVAVSTETSGATVLKVWVKRKTKWRLLVVQETAAPQSAAPPPPMQGPQSAAPAADTPPPIATIPARACRTSRAPPTIRTWSPRSRPSRRR